MKKGLLIGIILTLIALISVPIISGANDSTEVLIGHEWCRTGKEFEIKVYINPSTNIGGWEIYKLRFNTHRVYVTEVIPGPEWDSFFFDCGTIDNDAGEITEIQTLKFGEYPDFNHVACIIKGISLRAGISEFTIDDMDICNDQFELIPYTSESGYLFSIPRVFRWRL